jgi:hypothetical protein
MCALSGLTRLVNGSPVHGLVVADVLEMQQRNMVFPWHHVSEDRSLLLFAFAERQGLVTQMGRHSF